MKLRFFNLKKNWSVKNFGWSVTLVFFWRWFHFCNYFRPIMAGSMPEIEFVVFGQPIGGHVAWWRDRWSPDMAKSPDRGTVARSATVPSEMLMPNRWSSKLNGNRYFNVTRVLKYRPTTYQNACLAKSQKLSYKTHLRVLQFITTLLTFSLSAM